jgi:hypothetical protein
MECAYQLAMAQEGATIGCDFCSGERLCGDLLTVYLRKCILGKMETFTH